MLLPPTTVVALDELVRNVPGAPRETANACGRGCDLIVPRLCVVAGLVPPLMRVADGILGGQKGAEKVWRLGVGGEWAAVSGGGGGCDGCE